MKPNWRFLSFLGTLLVSCGLLSASSGCAQKTDNAPPKGANGTPGGDEKNPAILEAMDRDKGEGLQAGQSREVVTGNGVVIVSKNAEGKISYKRK